MGVSNHAGTFLATGLGFTEGPAVRPDGEVLFTSIAGNLYSVRDGSVEVAVSTGFGPTGLAIAADTTVYVAGCSGLFGAPTALPAGVHRFVAGQFEPFLSARLEAPNDICFGPDGRLWFTDPTSNPRALFDEAVPGRVCMYDFANGDLVVVDRGGFFPNGIAFDRSGEILYVSESFSKRIVSYRVSGGQLAEKTVLVELESTPDGMAIDIDGNIWQCCNPMDAIVVVSPSGKVIDRFETGDGSYPSNCCFAGADLGTLFVTLAGHGAIATFTPGVRGLPLYPFR